MKGSSEKRKLKWMKTVTIALPESYTMGLHELVRRGMYPNRSAAIRAATRDLLKRKLWIPSSKCAPSKT